MAWALLYGDSAAAIPIPSVADVFYVAAYVPFGASVLLLVAGTRTRSVGSGLWLDGIVVAITLITGMAYLVLPPLLAVWADTEPAATLTNAAYPIGDAVVVAALVSSIALRNWRLDLRCAVLALAFCVFVASDSLYLVQIADGTYRPAGLLDVGWLVAGLLAAAAAWLPASRAGTELSITQLSAVVPSVAGAAAVTLLLVDQHGTETEWLLAPVAVIALLIFVRFTLISHDNHRLIAHNRAEAITDALTGLANRRRLIEDLAVPHEHERTVILFDLDGFKLYNDTFGHPAGDVLLQIIGRELAAVVGENGVAYRLGGDEFCAVLPRGADPDDDGRRLAAAMAHQGHGFNVGASYGATTIAAGAAASERTISVADERLYVCKNGRRSSADEQSAEVLLAVLAERTPDLNDHATTVADLAHAVARRLGLDEHHAARVRRAAALHDIGKIAIPDDILAKPRGLTEDEWRLMRQHTVIGERILAAAPALRPVAEIVRSSHERWDGRGYPDALAGEAIPLGARIVFACDAYDAMTSSRPYNQPMSEQEAIAELRSCSGTQFDPDVVAALVAVLGSADSTGAADRRTAPAAA
ncbi:diguanylate cyclase [Solirubrobacter phytolaccae]|uniref:Diguanylate cyclase n=1 Tax=Solirubrobacter phytolaccae TaxID=1404360 RepID=A0A9X3N8X1_9ACTN|nr:HD domain-containing phosphohydrolase [Solirubrobacter phytolaccae]MDA0180570.1 diguanylate cyclase [Solirubrobacter phytolaccae]